MSSRKNCPLRLKTRAWTWLAYVSPRTMWHLPLRPRISSSPRSKTLGFSPPTSSATLSGGLPARPVAVGGAEGALGVRGPEISRYIARTARARNRKIRARNRYLRIVRATWGNGLPSALSRRSVGWTPPGSARGPRPAVPSAGPGGAAGGAPPGAPAHSAPPRQGDPPPPPPPPHHSPPLDRAPR